MQSSREQFVRYLTAQQWSEAASVSLAAMKLGGREEIEWHFHQLMSICNRWRVVRRVKTWLDNQVNLDMYHVYGDRFHRVYGPLVMGTVSEHAQTELQRQRRQQFRATYLKAYPVVDPLVLWLNQGLLTREQIG